ncbi:MAG: DUF3332 family protein [Planctomycetes bacterium]|nr:DUF3332 family protein [Planctomycetota bacterium]
MRTSSKWGLALAAAVLSTGCYGSFQLTQKIHSINGRICGTEKGPSSVSAWGNEIVYLIASPVYGFGVFVDALVLNSIEFWTGTNPMASALVTKLEAGRELRLEMVGETTVKVEILENGAVAETYSIERANGASVLRDAAGNEVAAATSVDGAVELVAAR